MSQRVLLTAGASGSGWAIARAFVANGARVHIVDVNAEAVAAITAEKSGLSGSERRFGIGHSRMTAAINGPGSSQAASTRRTVVFEGALAQLRREAEPCP